MITQLRLSALLTALFVLAAFGCGGGDSGGSGGDSGGCGPPPAKKEEAGGGGGGGSSGNKGGGGQAQWITQDKRGRVPKPYQRKKDAPEQAAPAASAGAAPGGPAKASAPAKTAAAPIWRITKRNVDGIADRVQVSCRMMAASSDGKCSGAANYEEIKARCCPGGTVERCEKSGASVVLVGRGCGSAER